MLVLTRKVGEGIAIGDDVKIVVMQIKGKQVRLGIKASASTIVHREEIWQRIQEENLSASDAPSVSQLDSARDLFKSNEQTSQTPSVLKTQVEDGVVRRTALRRQVRPAKPEDE